MRAMLPEQSNRDDLVNPYQDVRVAEAMSALLELCGHYMPAADLAMVRLAFEFAELKHRGIKRHSGEPYILHPIAVATYAAELALDAHGIAAALLHDTVEDTETTAEEIALEFGHAVSAIVEGVTKFTQVETEPEQDGDTPLRASSPPRSTPPASASSASPPSANCCSPCRTIRACSS